MNKIIQTKLHAFGGIIRPIISHLCFIFIIIWLLHLCFLCYQKWNEIPNQIIEADLTALGYTSVKSYCNINTKIIGSNSVIYQNKADSSNIISIYSSPFYTEEHNIDVSFLDRFKEISLKYRDTLANMYTFYVLDYYCHTSIPVANNTSQNWCQYNHNSFSYIDSPKWCHDSIGSSFKGSGFLAFPNFTNEKGMMIGYGTGVLSFNVNLINGKPEFNSPWDITQANYNIKYSCTNITCDTISIEFYGAINFSEMYPSPDKKTMSGIEFTKQEKIQEIMKNGLRLHTEFLEFKGLASQRNFILGAIVTILIAVMCELLFKCFKNSRRRQNGYN